LLFPVIVGAVIVSPLVRSPAQDSGGDLARRVAEIMQTYVARCTPDLTSQGLSPQKAEAVCTCVASALSAEMLAGGGAHLRERYDEMMAAQPNPNGSPNDRRLYQIVSSCFAP
jgi:hypothetical protein